MTPQTDIIPGVRRVLNDEVEPYRNGNTELLGWINDCLKTMVDLRPDLFIAAGTHACSLGAEQTASFPRLRRIFAIKGINGGGAITSTVKAALDAFNPAWVAGSTGVAQQWMPHDAPAKFWLYPPAPLNQQIEVDYVQAHAPLAEVSDSISLPENYAPAIQAYVINRVESKDDESINTGRAAAFMADFAGMVGASK